MNEEEEEQKIVGEGSTCNRMDLNLPNLTGMCMGRVNSHEYRGQMAGVPQRRMHTAPSAARHTSH